MAISPPCQIVSVLTGTDEPLELCCDPNLDENTKVKAPCDYMNPLFLYGAEGQNWTAIFSFCHLSIQNITLILLFGEWGGRSKRPAHS